MATESRTEVTYRCEKWRAISSGILETAGSTFLLLIAVRHFHAGATAKALVASGGSMGLLLSPLVVSFVERLGWRTAVAASRIAQLGAVCFLVTAALPLLAVLVGFGVISIACSAV